jgi:hypothetical protein
MSGLAVILGGNWNESGNSGSRSSNWNNSPTNLNDNIGGRGVCDVKDFALCNREVAGRPGGQLLIPASANTLRGWAIQGSRALFPKPLGHA